MIDIPSATELDKNVVANTYVREYVVELIDCSIHLMKNSIKHQPEWFKPRIGHVHQALIRTGRDCTCNVHIY